METFFKQSQYKTSLFNRFAPNGPARSAEEKVRNFCFNTLPSKSSLCEMQKDFAIVNLDNITSSFQFIRLGLPTNASPRNTANDYSRVMD